MKRWKTWFGVAISVLAIAWAMWGVEWSAVGSALRRADYRYLALAFLLAPPINIGFRALRWKILLLPAARVSLAGAASATAVGLMANNVLPARIGEFVRAYTLGRRENVPTGTAFGGLFVERMLDGIAIVGILYALTLIHDFPAWAVATARVALYIFVGVLAGQVLLVFWPGPVVRAVQSVSRSFFGGRFEESIEHALVAFVDGFHLLKRPGLVVASLALAIVQWVTIAYLYWLGLAAFGLADVAGFVGALFTGSIVSLGVAVPSSPGFVGTFQALVVKSLEAFEIDRTAAFTYSIGFHAANYLSVTIVGLVAFFREGLSWRDLETSERTLERELEQEYDEAVGPELESSRPLISEREDEHG